MSNEMKSIDDLVRMATDVQSQLEKAQKSLEGLKVEGVSGGGLVKVQASAKGQINGIDIDVSLLMPSNKEMLEDLVIAALSDARARADQAAKLEMRRLTAGMTLPPGFKF